MCAMQAVLCELCVLCCVCCMCCPLWAVLCELCVLWVLCLQCCVSCAFWVVCAVNVVFAVLCELCFVSCVCCGSCVSSAIWALLCECVCCGCCVLYCVHCAVGVVGCALQSVLCCAVCAVLWLHKNISYYQLSDMTESKQCPHNLGLVREDSKGKEADGAHTGIRQHCYRLQPPAPFYSAITGSIISQQACVFVYLNGISLPYGWSYHKDYFSWHQEPHENRATQLYDHTNTAILNIS